MPVLTSTDESVGKEERKGERQRAAAAEEDEPADEDGGEPEDPQFLGLLDDSYFVDAVKKVMKEPVPYFAQYSTRVKSATSSEVAPEESAERAQAAEEIESSRDGEGTPQTEPVDVLVALKSPEVRLMENNTPRSTTSSEQELAAIHTPNSTRKPSPVSSPPPIGVQLSPKAQQRELALEVEKQKEQQTLKKLPEFGNIAESILENTVLNIMNEALGGEYNITARRRFIALPKYDPVSMCTPKKNGCK